jgi:hypothetical protein
MYFYIYPAHQALAAVLNMPLTQQNIQRCLAAIALRFAVYNVINCLRDSTSLEHYEHTRNTRRAFSSYTA